METINLVPSFYENFIMFGLVFFRIASLLTMFSLFRREMITSRIIISLSAILAFYVVMLNKNPVFSFDLFSLNMLLQLMLQVFLGFLGGFILNLVFEVFAALGQLVSTQIGLSLASLIDPRFGNITSLTHFYLIATALIFLFLNGHLFILKTIVDSFNILPLNQSISIKNLIPEILQYSSVIFSGSILLSITIVIAVLLTNIALAVMTKFAPQFNIFSVGINMTLIFGLICIYLTFEMFVEKGTFLIQECLNFLSNTYAKLK